MHIKTNSRLYISNIQKIACFLTFQMDGWPSVFKSTLVQKSKTLKLQVFKYFTYRKFQKLTIANANSMLPFHASTTFWTLPILQDRRIGHV